ncbi:MAG: 2-hydroxyacyl-CoA dehydratase family protein [Syntrophomonadaceae bacterium]|nr:2-hydroxyacyl-CoA dehydratase family protein [Syntrophomonadaceae bacterium]
MSEYNTILEKMQWVVNHPGQVVEDYLKERKRPVIGCVPEYCPEEIVYAAGMLPIGMWGARTTISQATSYFPAFACSLVQSDLELGLRGVYDLLSAVIIPSHCDHLKCFGQDWKVAVPQVRFIPLVHPNNRGLEAAVTYLAGEYQRIRRELEVVGRLPITEDELNNAIAVYNEHRRTMREFTAVVRDYPVTLNARVRHLVIKSGYFMDKAEHTALVRELIAALSAAPVEAWPGKKIVLTGIMAEPDEFLKLFTENGLAVVADDLAQESRQFRVDVPDGPEDALTRMARRWQNMSGCPLLIDPDKQRRFMLTELAKESGADGVVVCMMKFCEMEEFDYPFYKRTLAEAGIPLLHLELDVNSPSFESARTRIQSFAEMLG